jgi:hypothetical protein
MEIFMTRTLLLAFLLALFITSPSVNAASVNLGPDFEQLKLVTQLPAEAPRRVSSIAYDGEKLWAGIYMGQGIYATLDPSSLEWRIVNEKKSREAISEVSGAFDSPGGLCFVNGKLWIGGSYGDSFGSIDPRDWKIENKFSVRQRDGSASQSYAGLAYDGNHLWIAWHWNKYSFPVSQTQVLLKVELKSGLVIGEYPLPPGQPADSTHGLTFDGSLLWHAKGNKLASIDPSTGQVVAAYTLSQIKRVSGLAWDDKALWISEFDGKIWRLPFRFG